MEKRRYSSACRAGWIPPPRPSYSRNRGTASSARPCWCGTLLFPYRKARTKNACLSPEKEDLTEIEHIASKLGIEFLKVDCREPYRAAVLDNFRLEYACGRTPNPCVLCNSLIKFGVLPSAAERQGVKFDKFATGHYARVEQDPKTGKYLLKKAKDLSRDQSYFLHRLTQKQLSRVLFPLGEMTKPEIREIARQAGLAVAEKEDSQDFYCGDYNDLLNFPNKPGDIVTLDGKPVARHQGIWGYTIGKRKGLGIGGFKVPMYVVRLDAEKTRSSSARKKRCIPRACRPTAPAGWRANRPRRNLPAKLKSATCICPPKRRCAYWTEAPLKPCLTSRSFPLRPASPPCSTTGTPCSAAE